VILVGSEMRINMVFSGTISVLIILCNLKTVSGAVFVLPEVHLAPGASANATNLTSELSRCRQNLKHIRISHNPSITFSMYESPGLLRSERGCYFRTFILSPTRAPVGSSSSMRKGAWATSFKASVLRW
jgi:hypothetical protein